uniref:Transmembrane protein 160 n=1 Tax=Myotis myotis TaxID=51298 RepID=A0A7J7R9T9_MYOMY|nr:transmembrane protein 160 [Myotis myotis]
MGGGWWWARAARLARIHFRGLPLPPPRPRSGGARGSFAPRVGASPPPVSELDRADAWLLRKAHETAFLSWFRNGLLASGIGVISFMQSDMGREAAYGECRPPLLLPPGSVDAPPTPVSVDSLLPHPPNSKCRTPHSSLTRSHVTLSCVHLPRTHCPSEGVVQGMVVGLPLPSDFSTKMRVLVPAPVPPTLSLLSDPHPSSDPGSHFQVPLLLSHAQCPGSVRPLTLALPLSLPHPTESTSVS